MRRGWCFALSGLNKKRLVASHLWMAFSDRTQPSRLDSVWAASQSRCPCEFLRWLITPIAVADRPLPDKPVHNPNLLRLFVSEAGDLLGRD